MPAGKPVLNHGGDSSDNPVLSGMTLTLKLAKQGTTETLRQVWVTVGDEVHAKLTPLAVATEFEITVPIKAGEHLRSGSSAVKNIVHFTTSEHRHAKAVVWCADQPSVMVTLDGYNASDWQKPLLYPLLDL